jgi:hypothetical protein
LIVESAASLGGTGKINLNGGILVAEASVIADRTTGPTTTALAIPASGVAITGSNIAAKAAKITITDETTEGNNIDASDASGKKIYVFGDLDVDNAVTGVTLLNVSGNLTASAGITTASNGPITVTGVLTANGTAAITVHGSGTLTAGSLTTGTGALTTGSGATVIAGPANIGGNLVAGGAVTFNGLATITGTLAATGDIAFNGTSPSTVTGIFTPGAGDGAIISGTGAVTFDKAIVTTNKVTIKNTGGVTLTAANTLGPNLVATGVVITGSTAGVGIKTGVALTVGAGAFITVPAATPMVAGDETGQITIAGAKLKAGTYTATDAVAATLTLATGTEIEVQNGGSVTIPNSPGKGQIVLTDADSKITLLAQGSLVAAHADGDIIDTDHAGVKLLVADIDDELNAKTFATVATGTGTFTVTKAGSAGSGTTNVIVGNIQWVIDISATVDQVGSDPTKAIGTLTAGAGTKIIIYGTT